MGVCRRRRSTVFFKRSPIARVGDILKRAVEHEQSVSALARRYDMSFAAVQKHIAVLERASLVIKERRGREQIVHTNGPMIAKTPRSV